MSTPSTSTARRKFPARRLVLFICFCAALSLTAAATFAQPADAPPRQETRGTAPPVEEIVGEDDVLKIDTDLVLVDVTVTDAEGVRPTIRHFVLAGKVWAAARLRAAAIISRGRSEFGARGL